MPTLTKSTHTTYSSPTYMLDVNFKIQLLEKINIMKDQGKTDAIPSVDYPTHTVIRNWLDQTAAEEFVSELTSIAAQTSVVIDNISIVDYE